MLKLILLGEELFNEETSEFSTLGDIVLELEHSLISLSKWESKHEKPFLTLAEKSADEIISYIECMIISPEVSPEVFSRFTQENLDQVNEYIDSKQNATTFGDMPEQKGKGETITAELIYYWMVAFNIPFECERWHLNRLFALIRVCNVKNQKPKKMSRAELAQRNRQLNAERRAATGSAG